MALNSVVALKPVDVIYQRKISKKNVQWCDRGFSRIFTGGFIVATASSFPNIFFI